MSVAGLPQIVDVPCAKVAYRSVIYARQAVREHVHESAPCHTCRRGGVMEAYHCAEYGSGHWHIGHRRYRSGRP